MKKFSFWLIYACTTLIAQAQTEEKPKGIAVRPVTLEYNLSPNQTASQLVKITNALDEPKQFVVYVSDWLRDTTGAHVYTSPGEIDRSCAGWIQLNKNFFELGPGETEELIVTMLHPADSLRGQRMNWCMLFVETTQEKKIKDTAGMTTTIANKFRVGIHVYQTPPQATKKEIKLVDLKALGTSNKIFRIICQNQGEVQLQCASQLEITGPNENQPIRLPRREFPLFPSQVRYIDYEIPPSLLPGKYRLTAILDAGTDIPLEAAQLEVEIN